MGGGIRNTKLMIDFCADKQIFPDIELIEADQIEWAWDKLINYPNDKGVRYVIDVRKSLKNKHLLPKSKKVKYDTRLIEIEE